MLSSHYNQSLLWQMMARWSTSSSPTPVDIRKEGKNKGRETSIYTNLDLYPELQILLSLSCRATSVRVTKMVWGNRKRISSSIFPCIYCRYLLLYTALVSHRLGESQEGGDDCPMHQTPFNNNKYYVQRITIWWSVMLQCIGSWKWILEKWDMSEKFARVPLHRDRWQKYC